MKTTKIQKKKTYALAHAISFFTFNIIENEIFKMTNEDKVQIIISKKILKKNKSHRILINHNVIFFFYLFQDFNSAR